jgi:ABC-type transport system substrate-binding protein
MRPGQRDIETPDKYMVELASDLPRPAIFDFFELFNQVNKDTMEGPNAKTASIGTGPFKFGECLQGDHQTFAKNPNHWLTGHPYVDSYVAYAHAGHALLVQFESGALDVARVWLRRISREASRRIPRIRRLLIR